MSEFEKTTSGRRFSLRASERKRRNLGMAADCRLPLSNIVRSFNSPTKDSMHTNVSLDLKENDGSPDVFENSFIGSKNKNQTVSPEKTAGLPGFTPLRKHLTENNIRTISKVTNLQPLDSTEDEDLPCTLPASTYIFSSVVAYVEVRSGGDNRSRLVMRELRSLGATVVERILKSVTHIVFKDGKLSTYKIAVERQIPMVSTQWISQCKLAKKLIPAILYPPFDLEKYKDPAQHKLIKRVKSFQPDYDLDHEQRMKKRLRRRKKRPPPEAPKPSSLEQERMIEYDYLQRYVKLRLERHQSPGECSLARALRTLGGPIDPKYDDYINRPVSPTSSEDDTNPVVPLAVKLLRKIKSPLVCKRINNQEQSENSLIIPSPSAEGDAIEIAMARMFGLNESSDTDSSEIFPSNNSCDNEKLTQGKVPSKTPKNLVSTDPTSSTDDSGGLPPAKRRKIKESVPDCTMETSFIIPRVSTPVPTQSTRAVRKLFNVPTMDDSPVLILPSASDTESSQPTQGSKHASRSKKMTHRKAAAGTQTPLDMDITNCVGNAILDDPSSMKTRNIRKSFRIGSRRSSILFATPKSKMNKKEEPDVEVKALSTIVCTSLSKEEVEVIKKIVKQLGGFQVEEVVSRNTTHVISMNKCERRTLNILRGIARGCWIVQKDWALQSLEAGHWIGEERFEWTSFSPAVQLCRYERQAFSPFFRLDFLREVGPIFVSRSCRPSRRALCELLALCGGRIATSTANARVVVRDGRSGGAEQACVTPLWILDSVQAAALKPFDDYVLNV